MQKKITSSTTPNNLRREAKRWLKALREGDAAALQRLEAAYPKQSGNPVLREVQHALAREYGHENWKALIRAVQEAARGRTIEAFEQAAQDFVDAYKGDSEALERFNRHYGREFTREDLKAEIWRRDYAYRQRAFRVEENHFPIEEARLLIAQDNGFGSWEKLKDATARGAPPSPAYAGDTRDQRIGPRRRMSAADWDALIAVMKERRIPALDANGLMTDEALARVAKLDFVTSLNLGGSRELTDDGLLRVARMPQLESLCLNEYPGGKLTDRGLEVLRHLPNLRKFEMTWQAGISDGGVANLRFCELLEDVNLMGSPTGDGAIEALEGKRNLRRFRTGRLVTDAGIALLRRIPLLRNSRKTAPSAEDADREFLGCLPPRNAAFTLLNTASRRLSVVDRRPIHECGTGCSDRARGSFRSGPVLACQSNHDGRVRPSGGHGESDGARMRWPAER